MRFWGQTAIFFQNLSTYRVTEDQILALIPRSTWAFGSWSPSRQNREGFVASSIRCMTLYYCNFWGNFGKELVDSRALNGEMTQGTAPGYSKNSPGPRNAVAKVEHFEKRSILEPPLRPVASSLQKIYQKYTKTPW